MLSIRADEISPSASSGTETAIKRDSAGRVSQFSYIRVAACFAIVLLHCLNTARVYYENELSSVSYAMVWTACSMLMWAVPCFLMVTGALLLNPEKEITVRKLYGKYIRRMAVALLLFTFIFTLIKYLAGEMQGSSSFAEMYLNNLLKDQAYPHLWYLYMMIILYMLLPLFRSAVSRLSDNTLWSLVAVMMIAANLNIAVPAFEKLSTAGIIYPAYLFIGYLIYKDNLKPGLAAALLIASSLALIFLTYRTASDLAEPAGTVAYNSPLVFIQASSAYSLMLRIKDHAPRWLTDIDACTFGIYLIHMIFVRICMKELGFDPFDFGPFAFIPMAAVFFLAAYGITWIIRKLTGSAIL